MKYIVGKFLDRIIYWYTFEPYLAQWLRDARDEYRDRMLIVESLVISKALLKKIQVLQGR